MKFIKRIFEFIILVICVLGFLPYLIYICCSSKIDSDSDYDYEDYF